MEFFVVSCCIIVLCILTQYYWSRRKLFYFASTLQGPAGLPLIGNGLQFLCKQEDQLNVLLKTINLYPSPVRLWMGPQLVIVVKDPQQLQTILQSNQFTHKPFVYDYFVPFLGRGLMTSSGVYHKEHRKLMQPLFFQKYMEGYSCIFQKHADRLVDRLKKHTQDEVEFNILPYAGESNFMCSMELMLEDNDTTKNRNIPNIISRFAEIAFNRVKNPWLYFDWIYRRSSYFAEQVEALKVVNSIVDQMRNTTLVKVAQRLQNNAVGDDEPKMPSFLETVTEMLHENHLTDKEHVDHLITFVSTGQDSQSLTISFACMMLGAHSDIQDRVIAELQEVLGSERKLHFSHICKLNYLEMCIKETLRLFPPAPFIFRDTTSKFNLEGLIIPEGVIAVLSIYNAHRDPNFWEKPNEFYPLHFTAEAINKRHPYAFIPFSAGPRQCIAQHYSYLNLKIVLSTILLNYEIQCEQTVKDIKLTNDIFLKAIDGHIIKLKKRVLM